MSMIRSILFKGTLKGNGIVNYDSKEQADILAERFPSERSYLNNQNVKIAKHNFYMEAEGGDAPWRRKLCISADCLRNAIFGEDFPFQNTAILQDKDIWYAVMASPAALLRGYMFAEANPILKRKSPVTITTAEQTSDSVTHFEIGTMSGKKRSQEELGGKSDTSMHYEEKIGEVEYAFEGALDLKDLQFVSLSEVYDRMAIHPDYAAKYRELLKKHLDSPIPEPELYVAKGAVGRWPEDGILLTQEHVVLLCKEFFKRLLRTRIQRAKAYANVSSVMVKFVKDPLLDTFDDKNGWKKLTAEIDLNIKSSDVEVRYEVMPADERERNKAAVEKFKAETEEKKRLEAAEKEKQKLERKQKKEQAAHAENSAGAPVS